MARRLNARTERLEIRLTANELNLLKQVVEADPRLTRSSYVRYLIVQCAEFDLDDLESGQERPRIGDLWMRKPPSER